MKKRGWQRENVHDNQHNPLSFLPHLPPHSAKINRKRCTIGFSPFIKILIRSKALADGRTDVEKVSFDGGPTEVGREGFLEDFFVILDSITELEELGLSEGEGA
jgi:hypothetical protein